MLCGLWDPSSPTRDQTQAPCSGGRVPTTELPGNSQVPAFFFFLIILFLISFWLYWVFTAAQAFPSLQCVGFSCGAQALGEQAIVAVLHGLCCSAAYGIFPDQGSNVCGRQILYHWTTKEAPQLPAFFSFFPACL